LNPVLIMMMKFLAAVFLGAAVTASRASVTLLNPPPNSVTVMRNPLFTWTEGCSVEAVSPACSYNIKITNHAGETVRTSSLPAIITRYVPLHGLEDGDYHWQVGTIPTNQLSPSIWSEPQGFSVVTPIKIIRVPTATATYSEMQQAFAMATNAAVPSLVQFDPISSPRVLDPQGSQLFLNLTNVTDVVVDFAGAHFIFIEFVQFVSVTDSLRVSVTNLTVDLAPLPYSALRVLEIDNNKNTFVGQVEPGHPLPEYLNITTRLQGEIMDGLTTRTKRGVQEVITFDLNWTKLDDDVYRITINGVPNKVGLSAGDVFVIGQRTGPTGFGVYGGHSVVFSYLVAHACANECFTSERSSAFSMLGCGLKLLPGRFKAANDGGHNHHSARIGQWIEGGEWESTGDDICHVSGLVMSAVQHQDNKIWMKSLGGDRYVQNHNGNLGIAVGDILQFFDRKTASLLNERTVVVVEPGGTAAGHPLTTLVTLDESPGNISVGIINTNGMPTATQVYNLNVSSTQFVFINNNVRNGRRFGVLAKGLRLWIQNNSFIGQGSGAVQLLPTPVEGLCARHALVANNFAQDVNQLNAHQPRQPFWTSVLSPAVTSVPCHKDVAFIGNTIDSGPATAFSPDACESCSIVGNTITQCDNGMFPPFDLNSSTTTVKDNMITNSSDARVCTKRSQLIKTASSSKVFFVPIDFGDVVSPVLHMVGACIACGTNLCQGMGVTVVDDSVISSRIIGSHFDCSMHAGGRMVRNNSEVDVFFQPSWDAPTIYPVETCNQCNGDICARVWNTTQAYFATLTVSKSNFDCNMA